MLPPVLNDTDQTCNEPNTENENPQPRGFAHLGYYPLVLSRKIRMYHPTIYVMDEAAFLPDAQ
jgi:hypothetical protein